MVHHRLSSLLLALLVGACSSSTHADRPAEPAGADQPAESSADPPADSSSTDALAEFPSSPIATVKSESKGLELAAFTAPEQPPTRGTITVKLAIVDPSGAPVEGLAIEMAPEMPSMGHGTPTVPRISAKGGGVYVAEDVNLFMAGRWDLRLTLTGAVDDHAIIPLDVR